MSTIQVFQARPASDGAGVKINRVSHMGRPEIMDPFLMLDEIYSDNPDEYIAGFPPHPHRGFETVTVMLQGQMRHEDHLGNNGLVSSGGGQWMTTGRGVIHSEIPEQEEGLLHGFQLWLNLAAEDKMQPASYQDLQSEQWVEQSINALTVRGIGGQLEINDTLITAPVDSGKTRASVFTVTSDQQTSMTVSHPENTKFMVYVYQGEVNYQSAFYGRGSLLVLNDINEIEMKVGEDSGLLVLSGKPLSEPVAQYGPFVMNTMEQVEQAIQDYRNERLVG